MAGVAPVDRRHALASSSCSAAGYSWQRIASRLNVDAVSTSTGRGRWYPASVYRHANPVAHAAYMRSYRARRNGAR